MRRALFILLLALTSCQPSRVSPLDKWMFSRDRVSWEEVLVPHSCNGEDGRSPAYYRGETHYLRTVRTTPSRSSYLLFEGAAQAADVYVNGDLACSHKGGYTAFTVPLKSFAQPGKNEIKVVCDNSVDTELIPIHSDFNKNNGLHGPVSLLEFPEVHLSPLAFGPDRMHIIQTEVTDNRVLARVEALLVNDGAADSKVPVALSLMDAAGRVICDDNQELTVPAGGTASFSSDLTIDNPHLWNGLQDPYLYTVRLTAGKDKAVAETGFRYFSLDRDKGFSLNGKPYPLRGVSMHQDMEGKALALSRKDYDRDYSFVRELGCNFLRLAHYPHNQYAFRLCDRMGLVVQTEIPWVNVCGVNATDAYFENIHSQMREMVTNLYNHPSIVFWGMWNELDDWGNKDEFQGPLDARRVVDETARLYDYTKSLDPTRAVGLTDDSVFARDYYTELKADYYSENRYHGWYYQKNRFDGLTVTMNQIHETMGITNLSEYGVGNNPYCHTWNEEDIHRYKDDMRHPEEYANRSHESHVQQICAMPWLNFTSLWILFDFPVADRKEGFLDSDDGIEYVENPARLYTNDKGLVTRDRQTKKDVFYLYKSWWNRSEETVYITGRRLRKRPAGSSFTLTVYSNAPELTLFRNGEPVQTMKESGEISGVIWKFDNLLMGDTETVFEAVSPGGTRDRILFTPTNQISKQ